MSALGIAMRIAATGSPVFPCDHDKRPAISKREGGRGFHDASTDPTTIRRLFDRHNAMLVGVPTGERSGFDVLDLDYRHGAGDWETHNLHRIPETRIHETKSGGRHLLFLHAPGVRNSAGKIAPGVDVRAAGGFVIAPPSPGYRVISDAPIAHWPDWLLALVLPMPKAVPERQAYAPEPISSARLEAIRQRAIERVRNAGDGQKHYMLRNMSLLLGGIQDRAGFSCRDAWQWLKNALPSSVEDWDTAEATVEWGLKEGRARPLPIEADAPLASDPRRRETRRTAFRLLRIGVDDAELITALQDQNRRRADPLPALVVTNDGQWAARQHRGGGHAA